MVTVTVAGLHTGRPMHKLTVVSLQVIMVTSQLAIEIERVYIQLVLQSIFDKKIVLTK